MPQRIIMPKTGMAMEEGTIVRWLKKEGDAVSKGEPIAEIETDKVTMDLEAEGNGVLLKIVRRDGETVPATETIAWLGEAGESVGAATAAPPPSAHAPATAAPHATAVPATSATPATPAVSTPGAGTPATPAARRLASERGINLASVPGSGPYGAVRVRDLDGVPAMPGRPGALPAAPVQAHGSAATLHCKVDVTELSAMVDRLNAAGAAGIGVVDFIRRAASFALPALGPTGSEDAFDIIDLSAFGVTGFTPPLAPPRTAVLGVGSAEQSLRLAGGQVEARRIVVVSLSHALGPEGTVPAAAFLSRLRMLLENPAALLA